MFTKFAKEHKKSIHQLFNLMWETTEYIRKQLAEQGYSVGPLVHGIENYILLMVNLSQRIIQHLNLGFFMELLDVHLMIFIL